MQQHCHMAHGMPYQAGCQLGAVDQRMSGPCNLCYLKPRPSYRVDNQLGALTDEFFDLVAGLSDQGFDLSSVSIDLLP